MVPTKKIIRKKQAVKRDPLKAQRLAWSVGHIITLVCTAIYSMFYFYDTLTMYRYRSWKTLFLIARPPPRDRVGWLRWLWQLSPQLSYRSALLGVLASYSVSNFLEWSQVNPSWYDLLGQENFQGILMAALFLLSRASLFKLLPFALNSFLQITTKASEPSDNLPARTHTLLHVIAYSELVVAAILLLDTLTFKDGTSGFVLALYMGVYWLRINFSPYAQTTVLRLLLKLDKKVPPKFKSEWDQVKQFIYMRMEESRNTRQAMQRRF
ncbi:LAMI_0B02586g1_1 [Lachancea mirantina]|uniref:LAMI_0B02586g1_1 n=1 Tax=Lachancea mirantina TaxID=1230905 RepID=A0A1G4IUG4_9SACH|nr:LAMI_0B02586g1_1 [Lachancea mirantina]